jgi:tripartite-type tricarboxylate transporter receptor subunit TctC
MMANCLARLALAAVLGVLGAGLTSAQVYPSRPISLGLPFSPGGGGDAFARKFTGVADRPQSR